MPPCKEYQDFPVEWYNRSVQLQDIDGIFTNGLAMGKETETECFTTRK